MKKFVSFINFCQIGKTGYGIQRPVLLSISSNLIASNENFDVLCLKRKNAILKILSVSMRSIPPFFILRPIDVNVFGRSIFAKSEKNQYALLYFFSVLDWRCWQDNNRVFCT